jgi:folate-binding protein YgfZ
LDARFAPLDHEALLRISGADTLTFLQGQSTCDTRELDAQRALPGLFCNPQGRALADVLLVQTDEDTVLLRLRRDIAEPTATTLGKYIAFSKATLEDTDHNWRVFGLWGESAADAAAEHFGATPGTRYQVTAGDGFRLVQLDETGTAFECLLHGEGALLDRLLRELPVGTTADWDALHIASGVARLTAATAGEYVPQNLNYDLTGHISFTKGCYTGQEVVARLHYRGKSKRRLLLGKVSAEAPAPGSSLYAPDGARAEGVVINAATSGDGDASMLVCTSPENLEQDLVLEGATATVALALPPYPLAD